MSREVQIECLRVDQLRDICRTSGIVGYSKLKKGRSYKFYQK